MALLDVNLKGTIIGSQAALKAIIPQKHGHMINVISTASLRDIPCETAYCAAKWGVRGSPKVWPKKRRTSHPRHRLAPRRR